MLRAFEQRSGPYMCKACRNGFSRVQSRCSRGRTILTILGLSRAASLRYAAAVAARRHQRSFATSSRLCSDPKPPPFPGNFGGFSSSIGKFGSFASTPTVKPGASVVLSPHELAARKKAVANAPGPTSPLAPKPKWHPDASSENKSIKSRTVVANVFGKPIPRFSATADNEASSRGSDARLNADRPSFWQSTTKRKVPEASSDGESDRRVSSESAPDRRASSQSAFDRLEASARNRSTGQARAIEKLSRSDVETGKLSSSGEVTEKPSSSEKATEKPSSSDGKAAPHPSTADAPNATPENPTFDGNTSSREDKKRRNKSSRQRDRRSSLFDEDDEYGDSWNDMQERKRANEELRRAEAAASKTVPIFLPEYINTADLAKALGKPVNAFISDMTAMGFENVTPDTVMTGETASLIAMEYGFEPTVDDGSAHDLRPAPVPEDITSLPSRPPVVTIMGHVDHGKTTLLDYLRKSSVTEQEHGGITQHIGAFVVHMSSGKQITFLDTPGHAAFLSMRQRGAIVTDIVVLVVAADDSVKPQTLEALKHIRAANVPFIVAINKVDKPDSKVDVVKADLSRNGVEIEDYGGDVQVVCVSGKTGLGMADLEESIITLAEILDVRAEQDGMAEGWLIESSVKQDGRAATVLVKRGTLRPGDCIVAGKTWARIRKLRTEAGADIAEAPPGMPVEILGWRELPSAGDMVLQAPDEDRAKMATEYRLEMEERMKNSVAIAEQEKQAREKAAAEALAAEMAKLEENGEAGAGEDKAAEKEEKEEDKSGVLVDQPFIVKTDVAGSAEAVTAYLLEQGTHEVKLTVLRSLAGRITEDDVHYAVTSGSIIINFNNSIAPHIRQMAAEAKVQILDHTIIYKVVEDVRATLTEMLPPLVKQRAMGQAEILQVFSINTMRRLYRKIAGCKVINGSIKKGSRVKLVRKGEVLYDGLIDTMKHVKKDALETLKGKECGIGLENFEDFEAQDQLQAYEIVHEKRKL